MLPRLTLDDLKGIMLENACEDFHKTENYRLLAEKHNQKVAEYETLLSAHEKEAVEEYLEVLSELQGAENEFLYTQGFKDCIMVLKKLTVLL